MFIIYQNYKAIAIFIDYGQAVHYCHVYNIPIKSIVEGIIEIKVGN